MEISNLVSVLDPEKIREREEILKRLRELDQEVADQQRRP
jgi:hypothetical protein